jgi:hypothetical protein
MINFIITSDWKELCGMFFLMSKTDTIVRLPQWGGHNDDPLYQGYEGNNDTWDRGSQSGRLGSSAVWTGKVHHPLRGMYNIVITIVDIIYRPVFYL